MQPLYAATAGKTLHWNSLSGGVCMCNGKFGDDR